MSLDYYIQNYLFFQQDFIPLMLAGEISETA